MNYLYERYKVKQKMKNEQNSNNENLHTTSLVKHTYNEVSGTGDYLCYNRN